MPAQTSKVLLIEDNPVDALVVGKILATAEPHQFELVHVDRLDAGLAQLARGDIDLVMVDLGLPDSEGLNTLIQVLHQAPDVPAVVFTSKSDDDAVSQAMLQGAQDYLVKGQFDRGSLIRSIRNALQRHQAEQALKVERDLAHAVLDAVRSLVVVLDHQGRIIRFNRACQEIMGYTSEDIWDHHFGELFAGPDETESFRQLVARLADTPVPGECEHSWRTKDGRRRRIRWQGTVLRDSRENVTYFIIIGDEVAAPSGD